MKFIRKFNHSVIYSLIIIIILGLFIKVKAQEYKNLDDNKNQVISPLLENDNKPLNFVARGKDDPPPKSRKYMGDYSGTDLENQCPKVKLPLTTLIYGEKITVSNKIKDRYLLNYTAQEKPSFWFYIPYKSFDKNQPLKSKLKLFDEEENLIFEQDYNLPEKSGIQEILFPANSSYLEINKKYYWEFSILCNSKDNTNNPLVYGTIKRVKPNPNLIPPLNANPIDKAKLYAEDGLWNETITTIIKYVYPLNPKQGKLLLNELLKSAQLEEISEEEIVQ